MVTAVSPYMAIDEINYMKHEQSLNQFANCNRIEESLLLTKIITRAMSPSAYLPI